MHIPSRGWRVAIAGAAALALVLVGTGAYALGTRRQGVPQKLYVVSTQDFSTSLPSPVMINDLLVIGTWVPGDLLVARLDAQTTCITSASSGPNTLSIPSLPVTSPKLLRQGRTNSSSGVSPCVTRQSCDRFGALTVAGATPNLTRGSPRTRHTSSDAWAR